MTRLLAIETATIEVGVAIGSLREGPLATITARGGRRQVETLHPAIEQVCALAGTALGDLAAVAVDTGPGLFTGLRVGLAAAKALAGALGIPVVGVSSLQVLAAACPGARTVVPVIDMRRGELAWSLPGGAPGFKVGRPEELAGELSAAGGQPLLVGDGALRYRSELCAASTASLGFAGVESAAPAVASLVVMAAEALENGLCSDPADLRPIYGREADARINWSSRRGRETVA